MLFKHIPARQRKKSDEVLQIANLKVKIWVLLHSQSAPGKPGLDAGQTGPEASFPFVVSLNGGWPYSSFPISCCSQTYCWAVYVRNAESWWKSSGSRLTVEFLVSCLRVLSATSTQCEIFKEEIERKLYSSWLSVRGRRSYKDTLFFNISNSKSYFKREIPF